MDHPNFWIHIYNLSSSFIIKRVFVHVRIIFLLLIFIIVPLKFIYSQNIETIPSKKNNSQSNVTNNSLLKTIEKKNPRKRDDIQLKTPVEPVTPNFAQKMQLEIGFHFHPIVPLGDLGQFLGMGMGGSLFSSISLPYFSQTQIGLSLGFANMRSNVNYFEAQVTMLPFIIYAEHYWIFYKHFRPYIRLGAGLTTAIFQGRSFASETSSRTISFDLALDFGVGIGYRPPFLHSTEILLYANFFTAIESTRNSFVLISLGTNFVF